MANSQDFVDAAYSYRLEPAEWLPTLALIDALQRDQPDLGAERQLVAGGWMLYGGPGSPMNHIIGMGLQGPVTTKDVDRVEEFYRSRNSVCEVVVSPYADMPLIQELGKRSYRVTEWNSVLTRGIGADEGFDTLFQARLGAAAEAGCDLAIVCTQPGSVSGQRRTQRLPGGLHQSRDAAGVLRGAGRSSSSKGAKRPLRAKLTRNVAAQKCLPRSGNLRVTEGARVRPSRNDGLRGRPLLSFHPEAIHFMLCFGYRRLGLYVLFTRLPGDDSAAVSALPPT